MDRLLDALETLLLRIRCGQTLSGALHDMPECHAPAPVTRAWIHLRDRIVAGEIPAEASLRAWISHLRLERKIEGLVRQRTMGPRAQSQVIRGLAWLFWGASLVLFPAELRPSLKQSAATATLLAAGTFWIQHFIRQATEGMWAANWLVFLSKLAASLSWGQTFGPALQGAWEEHSDAGRWPVRVKLAVERLLDACRAYESLDEREWIPAGAKEGETHQALEQLKWLNRLRENGQPLGEFIETCVRHSQEGLERKLTMQAEALSMQLLLPLFVCFLPGFLIALFGPVLGLLVNGSPPVRVIP